MSTVTVVCKTPNGFVMDVDNHQISIAGWNTKQGGIIHLAGFDRAGYTEDVPKDFWEKWKTNHVNHPLITNNLVHAQASTRSAKAEAKEKQAAKSGLEAIDPDANHGDVEKETK